MDCQLTGRVAKIRANCRDANSIDDMQRGRRLRFSRASIVSSFGRALLVLLAIAPIVEPVHSLARSNSPLDGRLGGTLASFESLYGTPSAGNPQDGADYVVDGIGVIFVQFQFAPDLKNP